MDDLRCSDWPKCRHPLLLISVCIFARVMSSEFTREFVMKFLAAQFSWIWRMPKQKFHPLKYFPSHRILKQLQSKLHRSFECNLIPATSYRSDKRVHFSNNQFMNGILTWFDCNSSFRNHAANYSEWSSLSQHLSVREVWCFSLIFFSLLSVQYEVNQL